MERTVTQWFPVSELPARPGVYQVMTNGIVWFSKWKDCQWHLCSHDATRASRNWSLSGAMIASNAKWRGLAEKPNEKE